MDDQGLKDLLRRAGAGEREASDELVRRYGRTVRANIRRRLGRELRLRLDTDDIFQSTFTLAIGDLPNFEYRGEEAFRAWLSAIAERRIRMGIRAHRAAKRDLRRDRPLAEAEGACQEGVTPSQSAAGNELSTGIREAVARLPELERRVVELHSFDGVTFEKVAERLGLSGKKQAHHLFQTALKKMAEILDSD